MKLQKQYGTYSPVYSENVTYSQVGWTVEGLTHIFHTGLCALNSYFALVAFSSVLLWKNVIQIVTVLLQCGQCLICLFPCFNDTQT